MRLAYIELIVSDMLTVMIPVPEPDISRVLAAEIDLEAKVNVLKAVAFLRKPSDEWFGRLETVLNSVNNTLRPARNRYAHDLWAIYEEKDEVLKLRFKTALKQPQSRKPRELTTLEETKTEPREIWATADSIDRSASELYALKLEFLAAQPKPSPETPDPQGPEAK